jgi:hypothetical protein
VGETQDRPFQLSFNCSLKVDFQGARVTSDGGLIVATAGAARAGREVVAHQLAAAVGQDRRTAHPTCALLLVAVGREPSNAAVVCRDAAADRRLAHASEIRRVPRGANFDEDAGDAGRSVARIDRETASSAVEGPADTKPATSATTWEHCGTKLARALPRKTVRAIERVGIGKSKMKSRITRFCVYTVACF